MPAFSAAAFDRLMDPGSRSTVPKPPPVPAKKQGHRLISPALYATPETTPLPPDSPSPFPSLSPYIVNHKRRGSLVNNSVLAEKVEVVNGNGNDNSNGFCDEKLEGQQKKVEMGFQHGQIKDVALDGFVEGDKDLEGIVDGSERDGENEDFFDLHDSFSTSSNTEIGDAGAMELSWKLGTPNGEYYDAFEETSSEGTAYRFSRNVEDELREMRLNLLTEIERRKQAEEAVKNLQNQWQRLSQHLSLVGLRLPPPPVKKEERDSHSSTDPVDDLCRQITISRFVAGAIARGCSRLEVEQEMQPQVELKNFEIARLCDRLQFYEAATREMSQRNQEAVEMARQQRNRRKRRQRWVWGSIGLTVVIGAAALAWSYLPTSKPELNGGEDTVDVGDDNN